MEINEFRGMEVLRSIERGDWTMAALIERLRDPDQKLSMVERTFIADFLDREKKRNKGHPLDPKTKERQFKSYVAYRKCRLMGDKKTFAYIHAGEMIGVTDRTIKDHVKALRGSSKSTEGAFVRLVAESVAKVEHEAEEGK